MSEATTDAAVVPLTASPRTSPDVAAQKVRNQAPGIPDRRKSTRPSTRATRGTNSRKSSGISVRVSSVADMASEMRIKGHSNDEDESDQTETFEDAASTPRPASAEPQPQTHVTDDTQHTTTTDNNNDIEHEGLGIAVASNAEQQLHDADTDADTDAPAVAQMAAAQDSTDTAATAAAARSRSSSSNATTTSTNGIVNRDEIDEPRDEEAPALSPHATPTLDSSVQLPPLAPNPDPVPSSRERSSSPAKSTSASRQQSPVRTIQGLSGELPIISHPPPSSSDRRHALEQRQHSQDNITPPPHPGGLARKASVGLSGLLGRMGSIRKTARSPPAPRHENRFNQRRDTGASLASTNGDQLPTIHDGGKPSLQDQFSSLRRQEEFGTGDTTGHAGQDMETSSEGARTDTEAPTTTSPKREERSSLSSPLKSPPPDPSLPPGTASGMSAGPAPEPREVNWDLWQKLVYEGPAVVAKTSGEQLNQAITSGIPPAIRGVVWQVLAESKNEELENVYRTLKNRGTESDHRPAASRSASTVGMNGNATEKDAATSDASSEHSDRSTAANSGIMSPPTSVSVESSGPELRSRLLEEKQKREAAALQKLEKAIKRDMGSRTSYSKFTQSAGLQDGLFGVCKAYALFDEGVGYAQGINFIAMPLLFNMTEEEAFTLLVRLMSKYDLRSMFTPDMTGLHLRLYHFERLLEEYEPAVYCHLRRRNVGPQLYATQWFLTLFAYRFPLQLVLRIYDLILSEGLTAILKFGIVLMRRNKAALLEMKDMSHLTNFLKERLFDVYIDKSPSASSLLDSGFFGSVTGGADKELYRADEMVKDACNIKISDEILAKYTVEWEENQRVERERESELEILRTSNVALVAKVKALEERVQQHDSEHVNIAQDLVRIKIENDALQDENEGLKLKVGELQKIADAQPAEVEEKLKEEMDRIMQRNIEVQNENRSLKEEMDEMEHELVNAKMQRAQTQSEYDAIQQKWSNLQTMLKDENT